MERQAEVWIDNALLVMPEREYLAALERGKALLRRRRFDKRLAKREAEQRSMAEARLFPDWMRDA